jgi:hypothetical protein
MYWLDTPIVFAMTNEEFVFSHFGFPVFSS